MLKEAKINLGIILKLTDNKCKKSALYAFRPQTHYEYYMQFQSFHYQKGYSRIRKISQEGYDRDVLSHKFYLKSELGTVIQKIS